MERTTLLLDPEARRAARQLAQQYDCSVSEAIRRAVVRHRDTVLGVPAQAKHERLRVLKRLFDLFEGNDPKHEVRRLKTEDEGF